METRVRQIMEKEIANLKEVEKRVLKSMDQIGICYLNKCMIEYQAKLDLLLALDLITVLERKANMYAEIRQWKDIEILGGMKV